MAALVHPLTGLQMTKIKEITNRILSRNTQIEMTYIGWLFPTLCYSMHFKEKDTKVKASMDISQEVLENTTPKAIAMQIIEFYLGRGVVIEESSLPPKKEKKGIRIRLRRKIRI